MVLFGITRNFGVIFGKNAVKLSLSADNTLLELVVLDLNVLPFLLLIFGKFLQSFDEFFSLLRRSWVGNGDFAWICSHRFIQVVILKEGIATIEWKNFTFLHVLVNYMLAK